MRIRLCFSAPLFAVVLLAGATALAAAVTKDGVKPEGTNAVPTVVAKSRFEIPSAPEQGRDPFFPQSKRLFGTKTAPAKSAPAKVALIFNGLSGTRERPLAMINGHTFGEGEEAAVVTASGRVQVRCIEIKGETAVVEVNGDRRELHFQEH